MSKSDIFPNSSLLPVYKEFDLKSMSSQLDETFISADPSMAPNSSISLEAITNSESTTNSLQADTYSLQATTELHMPLLDLLLWKNVVHSILVLSGGCCWFLVLLNTDYSTAQLLTLCLLLQLVICLVYTYGICMCCILYFPQFFRIMVT